MKTSRQVLLISFAVMFFAVVSKAQAPIQQVQAPQAAPAQAQMQPQSACGSQPLCTDTPDFTATITDFRLTAQNGIKIIDVVIRFQNKTNDALILGYVNGSEMAMDDQGNRYGPNPWGNAFSGIGVVNGNSMDPKFAMRAGSWGDARFELVWRPGPQDPIGSNFELAMSIREITTMPGGQHGLGGEFPLDFRGLANGVAGVSPAYARGTAGASSALPAGGVAGASSVLANGGTAGAYPVAASTGNATLPPCGPAGTTTAGAAAGKATGTAAAIASATNAAPAQNTASAANSTISSASAAISNLGSLFGKKKAAPAATAAAPNAASAAVPCAPAANAVPATGATPAVQGAAPQAAGAAAVAAGAKTPANASAKPVVAVTATQPAAAPASAAKTPAKPAATTPAKTPAKTIPTKTVPPTDTKKPADTDKPSQK